ncbi:MAG: glutamine--fructose-6-phosphate transaminase (isomerizing) [bacterium]
MFLSKTIEDLMCGIVGYVGTKKCRDFIVDGLKRLEYRGYDSAGFTCVTEKDFLEFVKEVGSVSKLDESLQKNGIDGFAGIGHTRWATHGVANQINAHPQFDCNQKIAVVHNGIIEDYQKLRKELISLGHKFVSDTDTEIVAHLLEELLKKYKKKEALKQLVKKLKGAYAFVILMVPVHPERANASRRAGELILVRRKSPLVVGVGQDENFVASDFLAFSDKTQNVIFLPEDSITILKKDSFDIFDFNGNEIFVTAKKIDHKFSDTSKQGFEHYMLKEIYEQKRAITDTVNHFSNTLSVFAKASPDKRENELIGKVGLTISQIKNLKKINLVAAGTSWHACRIAQFFIESICKIPASIYLASEFRYMPFFKSDDSLFIFVSQSGETADTLEALRLVKEFKVPTVALTNVISSTMVREADGFLHMKAGAEISVASTKAFSTQLASLFWLANKIALQKSLISDEQMKNAESDLLVAAEVLESSIENYKIEVTQKLAPFYLKYEKFIFLGRHISYPFAMEAALKLKEISYIFAQCYPAGELKHGPIALIDEKTPVVMFSVLDELLYQKLVGNAQEVKARNGHLLVFAFEGQEDLISLADNYFILPKVNQMLAPLAMTGLMQFFVYQITRQLGCPIDKPRNLAKSVTVE